MRRKITVFIKKRIKSIRALYYTRVVKKQAGSCGDSLKVNFKSRVTARTFLGNHVNFNGMSIKGVGDIRIGSYFHSGHDCLMISGSHNYDAGSKIPYDNTFTSKNIVIEDFVWLGDRVIVLGGSHIGEGAIIQAGSVVSGEIPPCAVAGGHPAKVYKYRDKDHFYELKERGQFH